MIARVDQRDVLDRLQDLVDTAEFELTHDPVERCDCGATLLTWSDDSDAMVCAGCGETPTYFFKQHPSSPGATVRDSGECGRDVNLGRSRPLNFTVIYTAALLAGFWSLLGWIVGPGL